MELQGDRLLLRIYIGESNRSGGVPLYEAIVQRARERGLSGATVLRGIEGFGANSRIHRASILRLSEDLPIVVEIVDRRERIEPFLVELDPMIEDGMVTLEEVKVLVYRSRRGRGAGGLMAARTAPPALLLAVLLATRACSPAPPPAAEKPPELATVEVTAAPDAAYSIADDKVERRANPNAMAGALPDGFPPDIPVYRPSSLVDFTAARRAARVVFATPAAVSTVSRR